MAALTSRSFVSSSPRDETFQSGLLGCWQSSAQAGEPVFLQHRLDRQADSTDLIGRQTAQTREAVKQHRPDRQTTQT